MGPGHLPCLPLPLPLQGTRHRESDRMACYGSSGEEEKEEATAEIVSCSNIHEMHLNIDLSG